MGDALQETDYAGKKKEAYVLPKHWELEYCIFMNTFPVKIQDFCK